MTDINQVTIVGRLTRDPELRDAGEHVVCDIRLASNRVYLSKDGKKCEDPCFVQVSMWNKLGETASNYLEKGKRIGVSGRLSFDQWEDQDGGKRSKHYITATSFQFLDSKGDQDNEEEPRPRKNTREKNNYQKNENGRRSREEKRKPQRSRSKREAVSAYDENDIPF